MHVYRETRFRQLVESNYWTVFETFCIHFHRAAQEAAKEYGDPQLADVSVSSRNFGRWMAGDLKKLPWPSTCRVLEFLFGEPAAQLFGEPQAAVGGPSEPSAAAIAPGLEELAFLADGQSSPTDADDAPSPHLLAVESFRRADRRLGGGHVYLAVQRYLRDSVAPSLFGAHGRRDSGEVFRAAAVLTEMAGWMAHDSGHNEQADEHFTKALGLAQGVPDPAVGANILASMSHLSLQRNDPDRAAALARVGKERLAKTALIPMLSARLYAMQARAYARSGESVPAQRALASAQRTLGSAPETLLPHWVAPFDDAALASESALALQDLGMLDPAVEAAETAVALRDEGRARSRAFSQIDLASLLLARGEIEAACVIGMELISACEPLGSSRITQQLRAFELSLEPYSSVGGVSELLDNLLRVRQHRILVLASLSEPLSVSGRA